LIQIGIIGLGYVGLPLAHAFSFRYSVVGYDISIDRVKQLSELYDSTNELDCDQLEEAKNNGAKFTFNTSYLSKCNVYIITVPTPIDSNKKPDLIPLKSASKLVGQHLSVNDIVIYESTVYPGATEEICVPILEKESNLKFNSDFFCGYSPERINPGDKEHTVTKIKKVTSGSTPEIANKIDELYSSIIEAGTYKAKSIKTAEAAKIIENAQRDINIAFINELAIIFNKMKIDTKDVLDAASTKWNFLDFKPGLVGGHCIGVDPYYLSHKAQTLGYIPEVILSGRRINDGMGVYIANRIIKLLIKKSIKVEDAKILVLGITFKENCPDIRNTKVIDIISELKEFGCNVEVSDYIANKHEVKKEYDISLLDQPVVANFDCVVLAVAHDKFKDLSYDQVGAVFDVKSTLVDFDERL